MQGFLLQIDEAEIVAHEADDPNAVVDLLDAEALAGKDGRDVDPLAMHADAAAGGDEDVAVVQRIGEFGRPNRGVARACRARRGSFMARASWGRSALNSLDEGVEASLLLQAVHAGRAGRFLLESEVDTLVAAVLLRVARLDALD